MGQSKLAGIAEPAIKKSIFVRKLDVSNRQEIELFYKKIREEFGKLYGLVNCFHFKGNSRKLDTTSNFFAGFEDYPEEAWDWCMILI